MGGWRLLLATIPVLVAGCPGESGSVDPTCKRVPGCESRTTVCCNADRRCEQQVCEGVRWTCIETGGELAWSQVSVGCAAGDGAVAPIDQGPVRDTQGPRRDGPGPGRDVQGPASDLGTCACRAGTTRPCGSCSRGTQTCKPDCSGYDPVCKIASDVCQPGSTRACPNGCGERTCNARCEYGACSGSADGGYLKPSESTCWSPNHCGVGVGRCVACWYLCTVDGNLVKDAWCATGCSSCTEPYVPCP